MSVLLLNRRSFCCAMAVGASGAAFAQGDAAAKYPSRAVRVVIPFPPGGTLDTVGRLLASLLGKRLGQSFFIDNRPGGNGVIGADVVAHSTSDGYTLLFNASTFTTSTVLVKDPSYDVQKDFQPIALVAKAPLSIAVNKNLPFNDIKGMLAYAKEHPGKLNFAIGSTASAGHLATALLMKAGGVKIQVVPYKGSSPAYQDLIGGQIDGFVDPILGALSYHQSGTLKIIAVTSKERLSTLPKVPTVGETIPGYEFYSWYGLWAPAKIPMIIAQKLNSEVNLALASGMQKQLHDQGLLTAPGSMEDFARFQRDDMAKSMQIIHEGGILAS